MRRLSFAVVAVAATVVTGCANGSPGELSKSAENVLAPQVQHVREVAATGSYSELRAAVANLKSLVRQQQSDGEVSASRATAIQDAADVLLQDARAEFSPSPTPSPSSESPTPTPTTESPTPTPTPTSESPTPTPSETSSPIISASVGQDSTEPSKKPKPHQSSQPRSSGAQSSATESSEPPSSP